MIYCGCSKTKTAIYFIFLLQILLLCKNLSKHNRDQVPFLCLLRRYLLSVRGLSLTTLTQCSRIDNIANLLPRTHRILTFLCSPIKFPVIFWISKVIIKLVEQLPQVVIIRFFIKAKTPDIVKVHLKFYVTFFAQLFNSGPFFLFYNFFINPEYV